MKYTFLKTISVGLEEHLDLNIEALGSFSTKSNYFTSFSISSLITAVSRLFGLSIGVIKLMKL